MNKLNIVLFANNDLYRTLGLMKREPLLKEQCAFFDFPYMYKHSFWNKNVGFPISLIFCDSEGQIKDIKYLNANQLDSVKPDSFDIKYVIEAHVDIPKDLGLKVGLKFNRNGNEITFNGL